MNTKQKFDRIDQSKLNSIQVERLKTISEKTNNFKIEDKDLLEKIDTALDNIIAKLEENNPEALKPIAKRTYTKKGTTKGSASKSKTTRTKAKSVMGVAKNPTNNIMSVAKEIQKAGESWKDAMERAKQVLKERKEQGAQKVKTEMDKLLALVRTKKELQGFANSNLRRDSVRTAKPRGARVVTKQGTTSNQYGTFDNKLGRKYWESRDRHADRLAPNYPKDMPLLAKGGAIDKYDVDRFKQVMNGKAIARYVVRLTDVFGNKETYVFGIRLKDKFKGCELQPYEVLYGSWTDSGTPFSLSNLQVQKLVPNTYTNIELDEAETTDLVSKIIKNDKAGVEKFLNTSFFFIDSGKGAKKKFEDILKMHFGKSVGYFSSSEFKIPENFANGGMTDLTIQNVSFKNGGNVTNEEKLIKELHRLQRDLNSSRLSRYREGDDSEEQKEKNRERESKLARFNEVLKTLRESDGKMANGGSLPYMTDPNFGDFQNTGSFELGGAFMTTDLAGHSGGGTGGLNADMPLSGVTGTNYTGLVGETGAMSSGELFENGGGIEKTTKVEDIKNAMYKAFQSYLDGKTSDEKLVSALNRILGKRKWFRFFQGDTMASTPRTVESALDSRMNRESVKEDMQIALDTKGLQIYNWEGDEIFEAGGGIEKKVYSIEKGNEPYDFKLYTYKEAQLKANEYMKEDPSSLYQPRLYNDMRSELPAIERMNMPKLDKNGKLYDVNNTPFSKGDLANYELGGAMMQNQQVINDASQPYVITESFGNPAQQLGMLAKGGAIENQYKGRTPEDVWNNLTQQQRGHFLIDHKNKIIANISIDPQVIEDFEKEGGLSKNLLGLIKRSEKLNYSKLNKYVKQVFEEHIENGEYAKGGSIPNNYEGRTPEDIWNNLSKPQRSHFLYDHVSEIEAYKNIDRLPSREIIKAYNSDWETLDKDIKNRFANHTREGQYANGGSVNKYFDDMTEAEILEKTVVYDNAESLDRYTVFTPDGSVFAMSETASGFNQYVGEDSEIKKGKHLGKRLKSVPKEIEWAVLDRMKEDEEYASGGSLGKALYVEWSSWFDSNKYDEEKIMSVLEKIGAKKIHLENDRGWSNQPEVVVFNGDKNKAQDALNEAFDTVWIRVSEKDWRNRKMADGGSVGDVSGNYYSTTDFVSQNDIMDLAKSTFGQDWESGGDYDYDTEEIKMLVKKLGGGYKIVYVDSEQREKFENAKSKYLHLLKNKSNDGDIFVIPNKKMAEGGEISIYNLRKGDKVKTRKGDIETIIKRTGSGSYETIENDYTHSPESLEFVSRPSRKMAEGGFMNNVYAEGGKVKSRKQRNDELDALTEDEYKVWNKIGARSGGQIRGDENLLKNYAEGIEEVMQKKGIAKASFNKDDYDYLTDNNYHLLNEFLIFNGYYDSKVTNDLKGFMIADFYQEVAENGKSKYYPNPDVITVSSFADGGSLGYEVMIDGNYDEPKKFSTFSLAKKWIFKNIKNHDSLELVDSYGDSIFVEGDATKEDLDYLFSNQDASFKKGGAVSVKLEKGVYRVGKPTKVSTNLYEQKIVEIFDNGDISTASDYGRKLGDFKSQKYPIITKEVLDAQYKMAEGGGVRDYMDTPEYKEMVDRMQKLTYDVKGRVVRAIGLDRAIEFYDIDYPVRPYQLIEKAVRSGFITLDEINERVIDSALETAQDSEDDEEVGSSDFTAYLHSFLNDAGFKVGFVKNHLTREYANGGELINHTVEMSYSRPPKKGERTNWAYNEIVTYDVLAKNKSEAKKKALIKFSQMLPNEKPKIISIDDYKDTFPDNFILEEGGGVDDHWELRREGDGFGSILHNGKKVDDYEWDSDAMTFWVSNPMGGQKSIDTPTKLFNHYKAKGYADGGMFDDNDGFMKADNNFNYRYPQGDVHVDTIDESIDLTNNMPSRNNKVVVESLDEDINLNDDKRIRAKLSYEPKDRTPEKMMMVNQRMVIENLPKPTMNSHRNND